MMKQRVNRNSRPCRSFGTKNIRGAEEIAESRVACREQADLTSVVGDSTYAGKEFRCTQNRRKRGFTLVEMMVSMALVLLVTAAVVASVQVSYRTIRQNHIERCAIREAENLALCFESKDYDSGVKLLYGDKIHATTENTVEVFFTQDGNAVLNTDHSAVWKLSATVMNDRLLVYAYRTADNELIYKIQVLR